MWHRNVGPVAKRTSQHFPPLQKLSHTNSKWFVPQTHACSSEGGNIKTIETFNNRVRWYFICSWSSINCFAMILVFSVTQQNVTTYLVPLYDEGSTRAQGVVMSLGRNKEHKTLMPRALNTEISTSHIWTSLASVRSRSSLHQKISLQNAAVFSATPDTLEPV